MNNVNNNVRKTKCTIKIVIFTKLMSPRLETSNCKFEQLTLPGPIPDEEKKLSYIFRSEIFVKNWLSFTVDF